MKNRLAKLIDVKSIMTLMLTVVFCILALCGIISAEQFLTIFVTIVGFYFGTQAMKARDTAPQYTGPEQSGTTPEQAEHLTVNTTDQAVWNETHPPDENVSKR